MRRSRLTVPVSGPAAGSAATGSVAGVAAELARTTPRDQWLLDLLHEHRVFTTDQVAALAFGSLSRTRVRLNALRARGVLDRFRGYARPGSQSWRWTLGPLGAAILAAAAGKPTPRPAAVREATARLAVSPFLPHLLGVNGFFVSLIAHARRHEAAELEAWLPEARATRETGNLVRPDGYGVWVDRGRRVGFWLEHDQGTESLRRLAAKLDDYATLAGTSHAHPVLFWLPSSVREANLVAHLARAGTPQGVTVVTAAADHAETLGGPPGRVWQLLDRPGRHTLAELGAPGAASRWRW